MLEDKKKNIAIELREEIEKLNEMIEEARKLKLNVVISQGSFLLENMNKPRICNVTITETINY